MHNRTLCFDSKSTFQLVFKTYQDNKKLKHLGKEPNNLKKKRNDTFKFEQKTLEIDNFNNVEEEINEKIEKRKKKKGVKQLKKKNKSLKQTKTLYEEKIEEKELWCKLNELNKEFQTINNIKKKQKSCLRQH